MSTEHSRIIKMVDHYGIPLRLAKLFAKHNDWKGKAGQWQRENDRATLGQDLPFGAGGLSEAEITTIKELRETDVTG